MGDCILIKLVNNGEPFNILVDSGIGFECIKMLREDLENIKKVGEKIDLLIITHIDSDHISGIVNLFEDTCFDKTIFSKIWFNSGRNISNYLKCGEGKEFGITQNGTKQSYRQGITLESLLDHLDWESELIVSGNCYKFGEITIDILSPTLSSLEILNNAWEVEMEKNTNMSKGQSDHKKNIEELKENPFEEDKKVVNKSSIAFALSYKEFNILMLGDSIPTDIINALNNLKLNKNSNQKVSVVKLAHHGSKKNTNYELLSLIESNNYIISTNSSQHNHPDKECLSRIICSHVGTQGELSESKKCNINFIFNYKSIMNQIFTNEELDKYPINLVWLEDKNYEFILGAE